MTDKIVFGVDPGKNGGIAVLGYSSKPLVYKMPPSEEALSQLLYYDLDIAHDLVVLERVRSSPQMGVVSAFTFGWGYGMLRMAFTAAHARIEEVTPQKWQKALGCMTGGDKNVTKAKAQAMFPDVKVTHWNADALLLAEYGRRFL